MDKASERIILALDKNRLSEINKLVRTLSNTIGIFKIGLEAMHSIGSPQLIEAIHDQGGKIFFDGKFSDIPTTVGKASKAVCEMNVEMFNVHASCGMDSIKAAAQEKRNSKLLVVTVLTSINDETSKHLFGVAAEDKVLRFAQDAKQGGADGIICSPQELKLLGENSEFDSMLKVTPGVRPKWAVKNDQSRTFTPAEAIAAGASHLVIGRPITEAPSMFSSEKEAAENIVAEIRGAM